MPKNVIILFSGVFYKKGRMSWPVSSPIEPSLAVFSEKLKEPSGLIPPPTTNKGTGSAEWLLSLQGGGVVRGYRDNKII